MKIYLCDPEKNTLCRKAKCKAKGGNCDATTHEEFAVLKNGAPVEAVWDPFLRPKERGLESRVVSPSLYLKPCKYCGNKDVELVQYAGLFHVACRRYYCSRITIKRFRTAEEAVRDWNREE